MICHGWFGEFYWLGWFFLLLLVVMFIVGLYSRFSIVFIVLILDSLLFCSFLYFFIVFPFYSCIYWFLGSFFYHPRCHFPHSIHCSTQFRIFLNPLHFYCYLPLDSKYIFWHWIFSFSKVREYQILL